MQPTHAPAEVKLIATVLGVQREVDLDQLRRGMTVELEHGRRDPLTDVTDDDPLVTAKIALAHLREFPDYYDRLERMEAEAEGRTAVGSTDSDIRVGDLMTIDPITVRIDASIEDAEDLMREHRITGLPVIDADGHLVGVVSQTDLLYLATPSVQALIRHHERGIRVGEIMSTPPVTIDSTATLREAARVMHDERLHRLVTVDSSGRPVGVLAAMDYVALAAEGPAAQS